MLTGDCRIFLLMHTSSNCFPGFSMLIIIHILKMRLQHESTDYKIWDLMFNDIGNYIVLRKKPVFTTENDNKISM